MADDDSTTSTDGDGIESTTFSNNRLMAGVAWAQGQRDHMQDSFNVTLDAFTKDSEIDFLGVFDGHGPGGENISRFVAYKLCNLVTETYRDGDEDGKELTFAESIESACYELDEIMRREDALMDKSGKVEGGSTCCCMWINRELLACFHSRSHEVTCDFNREEIYSCNIGDSRFIMSYQGQTSEITHDHKPMIRKERDRVVKAGGYVDDLRVNGILGVSRSFADYMFKEQDQLPPNAQLDIKVINLDDGIDFLIIATDGLWDVWQSHEAVDFVNEKMEEEIALNKICEDFIRQSVQEFIEDPALGQCDNITVILALFR